ncbi:LOW QUALITY PROTEIN: transmembrane protein 51b [Clupea harengus]|uniref:LOW QUALITY PROTEIN: transmembrane protein 51b n=1 Tax=Clupea harengus TaxID=7950 RepID=A0A6P8F5J8_CLUHA|nr:LOW QUALITY PROTEIN: transmembrane protein 51b [Clupea harengus]
MEGILCGMCSSRAALCGSGGESGQTRGSASAGTSDGSGSGSQYALCALGVGLVALGVVMIIWTIVPFDGAQNSQNASFSKPGVAEEEAEEVESKTKTSSVAFVLVGSGVVMLLLAICLGIRNKKRTQRRGTQQATVAGQLMNHAHGEEGDASDEPPPTYSVPSYDEAVGSGQYPIRQSNLRNSTTHLPSYEDLIAAVENEGAGTDQTDGADGAGPSATPPPEPQTSLQRPPPPPAAAAAAPSSAPPQRSSSRASRILRPLRVRRIKSEKLHLKDFRLNIRSPAPGTVKIEPLTPPPQYDDKAPEF